MSRSAAAAAFARSIRASFARAARPVTSAAAPRGAASAARPLRFASGVLVAGAVSAAVAAASLAADDAALADAEPAAEAPPAAPSAGTGASDGKPSERDDPNYVAPVVTISPGEFGEMEVTAMYDHTRDSKLVCVAAAPEGSDGEMPTASFVLVRAVIDGKEVVRPYTPIFSEKRAGMILAVKEYDEGVMSKHLCSLKPGDKVEIKGPLNKLEYKANMKKDIVMIAGGSGITPMYQVLTTIWRNPADETNVTLVYANRSVFQVMLGHVLETMFHYRQDKGRMINVIEDEDKLPEIENVIPGRITPELLKDVMPAPSNDSLVLVCGPPPMVEAICGPKAKDYSQGPIGGMLKDLGWNESQVYKF